MAKRSKKMKAAGREIAAIIPAKNRGTDTVASETPAWFSQDWLWGLVLVVAVILVYQPVWYAGFIWDDDSYITTNLHLIGLAGLREIWTTSAADISPLTSTTFWVEHALWGLAPLPYHLVNVLMHGACVVVLWRVLRSLQMPGAWLGAALWALHPVEVESVAWITETKNTQSGLFFLLSILLFVRCLRAREGKGRGRDNWNYGLTLLFAGLAMASKSSTVVLPVVLCLCAWWMEGRWQWHNVARVAPIFILSIAASALSIWTQGLQLAMVPDPQWVRNWPERLATTGDAVWFYLGKLLWPHPLITVYPRWQIDARHGVSYLPLVAVIIAVLILWLKRKSWSRPWFFVFAYFLVALFPVLGLADNFIFCYSLVFDHLQYLASMGPLALAGAGMVRLAEVVIPGRSWLQSTLGAGVLLVLGLVSWQRVWAYESQETLWTDTLAKNPNCWVGYNNLGNFLAQKGQTDEAIKQYQNALEINTRDAKTHNNLGLAFYRKGQTDEAIAQFQETLEINPNYDEAHDNLGVALAQKGQVDEAIAQFQKALEISTNLGLAHHNLGIALSQKGQVGEATEQFQEALEIRPNIADVCNRLGIALAKNGQLDKAIAQFRKALKIDPKSVQAYSNLGNALFLKGQINEAIAQLQEALRLDPNYAAAQNNLAIVQAKARQVSGSK